MSAKLSRDLTLEAELSRIFASSPSTRNREILMGYYGWKDGQTHTLTEIGDSFGITRERVRQICAKLIKKLPPPGNISVPVMDRALALIGKRIPAAAEILEAELLEKGLTAIGMSLEVVSDAANLLSRSPRFKIVKIDQGKSPAAARLKIKAKLKPKPPPEIFAHKLPSIGRLAVRPDQVDAVQAIADLAKKEVYFHGLATVARIERMIARRYPADQRLVRQVLLQINAFHWLDESAGWFAIQGITKHGLPKAIEKVLAVAGDVTVTDMHGALSRNRRLWKEPLPEKVLLEYCRLMPGVRIEGNRIHSDPPRNWKKVLAGVEAQLIAVLKKHGPLMDRGAMEDLCVAAGMNRFSFHAFVSWSPVIQQFGHSLYGPIGAQIPQEQVDNMLARRRANRGSQRVLHDHGVAENGNVWLKYRLSKAASTYAVITIPAVLKKIVRGRFQLLAPDGRDIGTLAAKDGRAWGLGAYLRRCGAKFGDQVALNIDLANRTATVSWKKITGRNQGKK
ncbi:MAG: sigma factor-like helix-turn-helix DNA-binding protein [Thermoguttaceae bacterium]